jgi:glycosyltransferase involved in cell wall biosynthesis
MANKVLVDLERMKYPNTGLYHYCLHLGKHLAELAPPDTELSYFVPPSMANYFGDKIKYIKQKSFHKLHFPNSSRFNVWHATHQATDYFPFTSRAKKVLTIHDLNYINDKSKSEGKRNRYLKSLIKKVNYSDHIIAISKFVMNDLLKYVDIPAEKRSVIYNGCNIEEPLTLIDPLIKPSQPYLFTIGVINPKKNFHVLPPLLMDNDWQLVISGVTDSNDYKERVLSEAKKYNVENRLIFTGPVSENDKQWYYKNCNAFVFPSIAEGFGLPVIEAMYFGKPVLLSTSSSLPEIGGDNAYYFKDFDPESMSLILKESLSHYEHHHPEELIKQRALSFNWKHTARQYINIYQSLL